MKKVQREAAERRSCALASPVEVSCDHPGRQGDMHNWPGIYLVATFVGVEPKEIHFVREAASFVKRHSGNIVANDFIRHGDVINTQFVVEGELQVLRDLRIAVPVFASELGVTGITNDSATIADPIEIRSQGQYRISIHGRDYKGLLCDILSKVQESQFQIAQCHGRLRSLWPDEIPLGMREYPDAQAEYLLNLTLQPTPNAMREVLEKGFGELYDDHGVIWSPSA